jgi:hypothetical protein
VGAALSIFLTLSLLGFVLWFLKSPHFLDLLHRELARRFETDVRIGSLDLRDPSNLILRDVKLGDGEDSAARMALPFVAVGISLEGLRKGRVDSLTLRNPKLFLRPARAGGRPPGGEGLSLPVNLGRLDLEDGELVLHLAERTLRGGFSFDARMEGKNDPAALIFSGNVGTVAIFESSTAEPAETAALGKDLVRSVVLQGKLTSLAPHRLAVEARVCTDGLSLQKLQQDLLVPLGFADQAISVTGILGGNTTLAGTSPGELQWHSDILVDGFALSSAELGVDLHGAPLHLVLKGAYTEETDRLQCELLEARLADYPPWSLRGDIADAASGNPGFDLHLEGAGFPLSALKGLLAGSAVEWLQALEMTGQGAVRLGLSGTAASPRVAGAVHMMGERFQTVGMLLEPFEMELPFACGSGECRVRDGRVQGKTVMLDFQNGQGLRHRLLNARLKVPHLRYAQGVLQAPETELRADRIAITRGSEPYLSERGVALEGDLGIDLEKNTVALRRYRLRSETLGEISGDVDLTMDKTVTVQSTVRHRGLNLKTLAARFPKRFTAAGEYALEGTAGIHGVWTITIPRQGPTGVQGKIDVTFRDGGFASPDGTRVAAGVRAQGSGRFDFSLPMKRAAFALDTRVSNLEILWGPFYGDFSRRPLSLKVAGAYRLETDRLDLSHLSVALSDVGSLMLSGSLWNLRHNPAFDARVRLVGLSNGDAYDFFIRETFQESFPLLATLNLDGRTDLDLTLTGTRQRMGVQGEIRVTDMNLHSAESGIGLEGLQLRLPVDIAADETPAVNVLQRTGSLRVANLAWKALQTGPVELFPVIWQDSLNFKGDVTLPLFGGRLVFKEIAYRELFNPKRNLGLSADIEDFDLSEMSVALGLPRFQGTLSGTIPTVTFSGRRLMTTGEIVLKLFGGEVTIEGISVNNVFSPVASMESTVALREIDLGRLTDTFEFGHISGILEGYIRDLVITNGQPESFLIRLGTVKRKGVPQRISVEALEKISILGSGTSPSIFGRGVYGLFKEYRYAKLGFSGRLRNDNFTLLGIVREGDLDYLVRGGVLPPKVNVINYTQEISFREMVKRLQRVQLAGEVEKRPRE